MASLKILIGRWMTLLLPLFGACATMPPRELTDAQLTYRQVAAGPAAQAAPDELHKARAALDQAELAFANDPDGEATRDLAYVAQRKALLAEEKGAIAQAAADKAEAEKRQAQAQARLQTKTEGALQATRQQLAETERQGAIESERREARAQLDQERAAKQATMEKLNAEQEARATAELKAEQAMQDLAKIAATREEERGTVLTLSGDVLFASGESTLLPSAQLKLNQVAEALQRTGHRLMIEGHTDSRGGFALNQQLSFQRAQAVRDYLVSRGIAPERCQVVGYGMSRPLADNRTPEGRANNRRVEIIVESKHTANR